MFSVLFTFQTQSAITLTGYSNLKGSKTANSSPQWGHIHISLSLYISFLFSTFIALLLDEAKQQNQAVYFEVYSISKF